MIERAWGGIVTAWRLFDRCGEFLFTLFLAGSLCLWLAGSLHAGHFLNWVEFMACRDAAFDWITKGFR
jgi:hypothetical protein